MAANISLQGVDEAISSLNYRNQASLKYKLINTIRNYYEQVTSIESIQEINADELIKALWDTGDDPVIIKNKRKNLNIIKSSVNADLESLYEKGKNTEGITIGPLNTIVMSDEARDALLSTFRDKFAEGGIGEGNSLGQIAEVMNIVSEMLSNLKDSLDGTSKLDQLRDIVRTLSENLGMEVQEGAPTDGSGKAEIGGTEPEEAKEFEEVYEDGVATEEVDEIEEVDEDEVEDEFVEAEEGEELEEVEADGDIEEDESDPDEIVEDDTEIADDDEVVEEVVPEELEEVDEDEVAEEIDHEDDLEEVDEGLDEIVEDDTEIADDDEVVEEAVSEELEEVDEDEVVEEAEIDEDEELEDLQGDGVEQGVGEGGSAFEELQQYYYDERDEDKDGLEKSRSLAENFNNYLGSVDRSYNEYILIPGGEYIVGSKAPKKDEQPEKKVRLAPYDLGKFPVINAFFEIFVDKTGYKTTAEKLGHSTVYSGRLQDTVDEETGLVKSTCNASISCKTIHGACWYQPTGPGSTILDKRNHPVVHVSLEDAMAFAAWTGKRLPTENEWEVAARGANGQTFPWGNDWKNGSCNIEESARGDTTPVDNYLEFASESGIVDIIGNVLEWTMDTCEAPFGIKNNSSYYIVKGGSWISGNDVRLTSRFKLSSDSTSNILGFRCLAF